RNSAASLRRSTIRSSSIWDSTARRYPCSNKKMPNVENISCVTSNKPARKASKKTDGRRGGRAERNKTERKFNHEKDLEVVFQFSAGGGGRRGDFCRDQRVIIEQ